MSKHKSFYFLAGFLLLPAVVAGYYFLATNSGKAELAQIEAKSKSKWQRLLEKKGVDVSFWKKYLPYVRHTEYKKALTASQSGNPDANLQSSALNGDGSSTYLLHRNISTTYFWAGEDAGADNGDISNHSSCWDESWDSHCKNENPYYFALPYNDFDDNGHRKAEALKIIPWVNSKNWAGDESLCKNQWIKITHDGKVAYAQWEDAGPFGEDDAAYVFGTAGPKSKTNDHAGLDVSPAIKNYLGLDDVDKTDWQFIDAKDIPAGPWSKVITSSGVFWN